jgi:tRNA uridine 5-carboxymethylaminomethyl modification enzyme
LGVLIDDLITLGTNEPYRMFTSRAEYRLVLREDNADLRLTEAGRRLGLVEDNRWSAFCEKREAIEREQQRLVSTWIVPNTPAAEILNQKIKSPITHEYSLMELLKRPELSYQDVAHLKERVDILPQAAEQVEIEAKYSGYIARQQDEIEQLRRFENTLLPDDFTYEKVGGLSNEVIQKLQSVRPETLGIASRISGVTPAAISQLLIYLKKHTLLKKPTKSDASIKPTA